MEKPIKDFEDYIINDSGINEQTVWSTKTNKWMKPTLSNGYYMINLCKNGVIYHKTIHKLIAESFIPNPQNKPCIDHINGNSQDNSVFNLRWCSYEENNNNPITRERMSQNKNRINVSKEILQYTLNGEFVRAYLSAKDANRISGFSSSHIADCCRGERKTHKGFKWTYK